jgi:hypothetical protein
MFVLGFVFMLSLVSASVSLTHDLNGVYNLGDSIDLNLQLTAEQEIQDIFEIDFVCEYDTVQVYREFLFLSQGDQIEKEIKVPLMKNFIGDSKGDCKFEAILGGVQTELGGSFQISDSIEIQITFSSDEFIPGEIMTLNGKATKENGNAVEGDVEVKLIIENQDDLEVTNQFVGGEFNVQLVLPENTPAGRHALSVSVLEKDSKGMDLNYGVLTENIKINQIPKNLEIIVNEEELMPGETLKIKTILHDQSGDNIEAESFIAIKDSLDVIVQKIESFNDREVEYFVALNESPGEWKVSAYSEELIVEKSFRILENKAVDVEIFEKTLTITNIGNVLYDEIVEIEIGEEILTVEPKLSVGESVEYILSAPNGEYTIQIGDFSESVFLTGKAIKAKKINDGEGNLFSNMFVWIFVVLILGFVSFGLYRKGFKKSFFRKSPVKKLMKEKLVTVGDLIDSKEKLALSLSITGNKQDATVVCLKIKNYEEVKFGDGGVKETFKKIATFVEKEKGLVYENKGNLYFIFAPIKTKTFSNEIPVIKLVETIRLGLVNHNKLFKNKIDFGLSINYGTIVTKFLPGNNQFMVMGELLMNSRKIASKSKNEILLSESVKGKVKTEFKTEKEEIGGVKFFHIREEIKKGNHTTFIKGFLERQQRERLSKGNKK